MLSVALPSVGDDEDWFAETTAYFSAESLVRREVDMLSFQNISN